MALNNPAARLHNLLKRCRENEKMRVNPMMEAWRTVLALPKGIEDTSVMHLVGKVFILPSQIAQELGQFQDLDLRLYLGWKKDLAEAFKQVSFNAQFAQFHDRLSDSLLINIEFCAHELAKRRPEKMIDDTQLGELKQQAYELYEELLKAELPPELRRYLLDHLYEIIESIDCYLVTGACPLQRAVDGVIGTFVTKQNVVRQTQGTDLGQKFWNVMNKTALILDISKTALELGEGAAKILAK